MYRLKKKALLTDQVVVIETNIDDMSAEILGYTVGKLFDFGALDVFAIPIFMKKNRPATLLSIIANPDNVESLVECVLRETTTFGVRMHTSERIKLSREFVTVPTPYGDVRIKQGFYQGELLKAIPEYEDCARLAETHGVPLQTVYQAAEQIASQNTPEHHSTLISSLPEVEA